MRQIHVIPILVLLITSFQLFGQGKNNPTINYGSNLEIGKYADLNGLKLYYEEYGNGEPLLLIHGGLGSINDFENNINELSKHFHLIAVDSRGYGRSNNPLDSLSYDLLTDDMIGLLNHLKIDSTNILGFSDGGIIGLNMASKYPDRVIRVVASGANYLLEGIDIVDFANNLMTPDNVKTNNFWIPFREKYNQLNPNPEKFDFHIQHAKKMWLTEIYIPEDRFKKIKQPVLLIFGDHDTVKLEHGLQMFRLLPEKTAQLCILPGGGHLVFLEEYEIINNLIVKFLK
jgi:pimeloyl-ACP methyl ester carboxylesterase